MGWADFRASVRGLIRVATVLASAGLAGGCFQPLYGEASDPRAPRVQDAMRTVAVDEIRPLGAGGHIGVQLRNDLIFSMTGGGGQGPPVYRLAVQVAGTRNIIAVDRGTALPNAENQTLNAAYRLTEVATGKIVVSGTALTTVSYDPSGTQRFAKVSAIHDAERRAAKVIADNITTRLASYFVSGI